MNSTPRRALAMTVWVGALAGMLSLFWSMRTQAWPGLHFDAIAYSNVAINLAIGRGHTFDVCTPRLLDNPGHADFRVHGQLYEGLMGLWLKASDYRLFFDRTYDINILTFLLAAALILVLARARLGFGWWQAVGTSIAAAASISSVQLYLQGRPEHPIPLVMVVCALLRLRPSPNWVREAISIVEAGVVAAYSPLPGALLVVARLVVVWIKEDLRRALIRSAIFGGGSMLVWAAATKAVYPYSLVELLRDTARFAERGSGTSRRAIPTMWLFAREFPAIGLPFFVFAILFGERVWILLRSHVSIARKLAVLVLFGFWSLWVDRSGIGFPFAHYNLICVLPLILVTSLSWLYPHGSPPPSPLSRFHSLLAGLFFLGLAVLPLGTIRAGLLSLECAKRGMSFEQARDAVSQLKQTLGPKERIVIDPTPAHFTALCLDGPPWRFLARSSTLAEVERTLGLQANYLLFNQDRDAPPLPTIGAYKLRTNYFRQGKPRFLGIPLDDCIPGHQFALYQRESTNSSAKK